MTIYGLLTFCAVYALAVAAPGPGVAAVIAREHRAAPGIEQRIVLEHADHGFDGIEARTTASKH